MRTSLPITVTLARAGAHADEHTDAAGRWSPAPPSDLLVDPRPDVDGASLVPLLTAFYDVVGRDPLLGPYFARIDMAAHVPRIADFWSTLLFHSGRYQGNAFRPHAAMPGLEGAHFDRWVTFLDDVVDARYAGPAAERMKALGRRIAGSMRLRLGLAAATLPEDA